MLTNRGRCRPKFFDKGRPLVNPHRVRQNPTNLVMNILDQRRRLSLGYTDKEWNIKTRLKLAKQTLGIKEEKRREILTGIIPHLREPVCVVHHVLGFNVEIVEPKLTIYPIVYPHNQTLAPRVAKMQHRPSMETGGKEMHQMTKRHLDPD